MKTKKIWLFLGISLIILGVITQSAKAITITGESEITANCIQAKATELTMYNETQTAQTIELTTSGEKKDWAILPKTIFELNPKAQATIPVFIKTSPCAITQGNFFVPLLANNQQAIVFSITVEPIHSIEIIPTEQEIGLMQCEEKETGITVKNNGKLKEKIFMVIEGEMQNYSLSEKEFELKEGEEKLIVLKAKALCNEKIGEKLIIVKAALFESGFFAEKKIKAIVTGSQAIEAVMPEISYCRETGGKASIKIMNFSQKTEELELRLVGTANWAKLSEKQVSIKTGEEKTIEIVFEKEKAIIGEENFELEMKSKVFETTKKQAFKANAQNCFEANAELITAEKEICLEKPFKLEFEIENNGEKELEADIILNGIKTIENRKKAVIPKNSKVIMAFFVDNLLEKAGNKKIELEIFSNYFEAKKEFELKASNCYQTIVRKNTYYACRCLGEKDFLEIENTGTREQNYIIRILPDWIKPKQEEFNVLAGEKKTIELETNVNCNSIEKEIIIEANPSEQEKIVKKAGIEYSPAAQCYKIDSIAENTIVVQQEESRLIELYFENKSSIKQTVQLESSNERIISLNPKEFELNPNEKKTVFALASIPIDSKKQEEKAEISLKTNLGFEQKIPIAVTTKAIAKTTAKKTTGTAGSAIGKKAIAKEKTKTTAKAATGFAALTGSPKVIGAAIATIIIIGIFVALILKSGKKPEPMTIAEEKVVSKKPSKKSLDEIRKQVVGKNKKNTRRKRK